MIGKFLQEEENKTTQNSETNNFPAFEDSPVEVFTLPEMQTDGQNILENPVEKTVFRESEEIIEPIPLPENQETYTVAPAEALISTDSQFQEKKESYHETTEENVRRTGMAWTAATVLTGSVVFMLVIGWFFDLVFGSKPLGLVGGIIIGALIGFIQFFRITSRIFKKDDDNSLGLK